MSATPDHLGNGIPSPARARRIAARARRIAVWVLLANLLLIALFPPYDYVSVQHGNVPTFDGFRLIFSTSPGRRFNADFFWLECFVVLTDFCIAWLLLRPSVSGLRRPGNRGQRAVAIFVGLNLLLMLLFPPFENFTAISKAALPTFEGFFFVFGDNAQRQIVSTILYLEVCLLLVNGGLLWLFLIDRPRS